MRRASLLLTGSPRLRLVLRVLGALLLLFVALDHYYEYSVQNYSTIPTIGTLFLLNIVSASAIGLLLLMPLERITPRFSAAVLRVAAVAGFSTAASSLIALLVSEQTTLFGFMESNYRPAILVALASEAAAAVVLALLAVSTLRASVRLQRPGHKRAPSGPRDPGVSHAG
jgi:hypothetical protein